MTDQMKGFPYRKEVLKEIGGKEQGTFCKSFVVKDDEDETSLTKYTLTFNLHKRKKRIKNLKKKMKKEESKENLLSRKLKHT